MSKETMSPHFRKAVAEIDTDIAKLTSDINRLQGTRSTIVELYGGDTELPPPSELKRIPRDAKPKRKYMKRTPAAAAPAAEAGETPAATGGQPAETNGKFSPESIELMAHARKMPEPISAVTLAVASGKDRIFCTNSVNRWAAKGWLEKTGRGEYKRTNTFPNRA